MDNILKIYTDGGSRGNPGHAASAFVVYKDDTILETGAKYIGIATNNQAEYFAVLLALEWLEKQSKEFEVLFYLDSELVVKQLTGVYKIKDIKLQKFSIEIQNKLSNLKSKIIFNSIPREKNKFADRLVNETLNTRAT